MKKIVFFIVHLATLTVYSMKYPSDHIAVIQLTPEPGTPAYEKQQEMLLHIIKKNKSPWNTANAKLSLARFYGPSPEQMMQLLHEVEQQNDNQIAKASAQFYLSQLYYTLNNDKHTNKYLRLASEQSDNPWAQNNAKLFLALLYSHDPDEKKKFEKIPNILNSIDKIYLNHADIDTITFLFSKYDQALIKK